MFLSQKVLCKYWGEKPNFFQLLPQQKIFLYPGIKKSMTQVFFFKCSASQYCLPKVDHKKQTPIRVVSYISISIYLLYPHSYKEIDLVHIGAKQLLFSQDIDFILPLLQNVKSKKNLLKDRFKFCPTVSGCDFTANFRCRSFADYLNLPLLEVSFGVKSALNLRLRLKAVATHLRKKTQNGYFFR